MEHTDPLYREFLAELDALERFRASYSALRPDAELQIDDPDVRRLIEALALFSARTRMAACRNLDQSLRRIFEQHFSYLCDPMPTMALLQVQPSGRLADVAWLDAGARVSAQVPQAEVGEAAIGSGDAQDVAFCTAADLRVLPIALRQAVVFPRLAGGFRLALRFESACFRNDAIGELNLYVHHLGDVFSSLRLLAALRLHLQGAGVLFDKASPEEAGDPVQVYFGTPHAWEEALFGFDHPVARLRAAFHFPQQAAYLNVVVEQQPRNWQAFTLYFDLAPGFVSDSQVTTGTFVLHTVPMSNLARGFADAVQEDGTKEQHPLFHPDRQAGFEFHSLRGAYRIGDDVLLPLQPGVLGEAEPSYELRCEQRGADRVAYLCAHVADAFVNPVRLAVDAYWHQPNHGAPSEGYALVAPVDRTIDGVDFCTLGPVVGSQNNPAVTGLSSLLQLLSIKNQRFVGLGELRLLLKAVGADAQPYFASLLRGLSQVAVEAKPYGRGSRGFEYVYSLEYKGLERTELPALDLFSVHVLRLLTLWSIEEIVELQVCVPNLEVQRCYA